MAVMAERERERGVHTFPYCMRAVVLRFELHRATCEHDHLDIPLPIPSNG